MNLRFLRPSGLLSLVLAATVALSPTAAAVNSGEEVFLPAEVNEGDAPVIVSSMLTGTAMGLGYVQALGVNVRENPNMDAEVLTVISQGDQVVVLSQEGDWYRVAVNNCNGYVRCEYLTLEDSGNAELGYGLITAEAANVRETPDLESETVDAVDEDGVVTIIGIVDGWYEVELRDGTVGYVRSDLVDPTADIPAEKIFDYTVIEGAAVNLRSAPDTDAEATDVLYEGSLCQLVQQVGDWYEVSYGEVSGFVYAPLTSTTNDASDGSTNIETLNEAVEREAREAAEAAAAAAAAAEAARAQQAAQRASSSSSSSSGSSSSSSSGSSYSEPSYHSASSSDVVSVAMSYLGYPYVWGGTSPSGFDCSGFVQYVYKQCGYSLSRVASAQYGDGSYVSSSNLQPGDLVFFGSGGINHVGIYIGGGQFIHAANASSGVKINNLSDSYYSARYAGACRIA